MKLLAMNDSDCHLVSYDDLIDVTQVKNSMDAAALCPGVIERLSDGDSR